MNSKDILIFISGCLVGGALSYYYTKKAMTEKANKEIESVKEAFNNYSQKDVHEEEKPQVIDRSTLEDYAEIMKQHSYIPYAEVEKAVDEMIDDPEPDENNPMYDEKGPRIISPTEFAELYDYMCLTFHYFSDGVLVDDKYNPMYDYGDIVPENFFNHFGEYAEDPDTVYVYNERMQRCYEIIFDNSKYSDMANSIPHDVEVH